MTPQDIAVVRELLALAKAGRWVKTATGQADWDENDRRFHQWTRTSDDTAVQLDEREGFSVFDFLVSGSFGCGIDKPASAQQVADLLFAAGLAPVELTSGWLARQPEVDRLRAIVDAWLGGSGQPTAVQIAAMRDHIAAQEPVVDPLVAEVERLRAELDEANVVARQAKALRQHISAGQPGSTYTWAQVYELIWSAFSSEPDGTDGGAR